MSYAHGLTTVLLGAILAACGSSEEISDSGARSGADASEDIDSGASEQRDVGVTGTDGGNAAMDAGFPRDAGQIPGDAGLSDSGPAVDAGFFDGGVGHPDASAGVDASTGLPDSGMPPAADVDLSFTGCNPDFGGDLFVAYNGSIAVTALISGGFSASVQLDLAGQTGTIPLSSQHRVDTGLVVNLITSSTWTNIAQDPDVYNGSVPDPIGGTLIVRSHQPAQGIMDIGFQSVTLQNVVDDSLCTINGNVSSSRLGY